MRKAVIAALLSACLAAALCAQQAPQGASVRVRVTWDVDNQEAAGQFRVDRHRTLRILRRSHDHWEVALSDDRHPQEASPLAIPEQAGGSYPADFDPQQLWSGVYPDLRIFDLPDSPYHVVLDLTRVGRAEMEIMGKKMYVFGFDHAGGAATVTVLERLPGDSGEVEGPWFTVNPKTGQIMLMDQ